MKNSEQIRAAARHELGHAVVRWLRTGSATRTTISKTRPGNGHSGRGKRSSLTDQIQWCMAGVAAEMNYTGTYAEAEKMPGGASDFSSARQIANAVAEMGCPSDPPFNLEVCFKVVCMELCQYKSVIDALTPRLMAKGVLTAAEINAALEANL